MTLLSHAAGFKRRQAVRETWANSTALRRKDEYRAFFFVAKVTDGEVMRNVCEEAERFGDIIVGEFYESMYNNSWKLEMMFEWVRRSLLSLLG